MTTSEITVILSSDACVHLCDGLHQLPQIMGGEAAMQILRLPSVLIHIPECSPGENSGVASCAR